MLESNSAPVPLPLPPNTLFMSDDFSDVPSFSGDNNSACIDLSSPLLNQMNCSSDGAGTGFLDSFDITSLPIDAVCTNASYPTLLNGNMLAFADSTAALSACHPITPSTSKPALLLLGMVQMQTSSIVTLDSIIAMVSERFMTPRQGRDMVRILFTSQRTEKNIYTIDLFGCGTCPLRHVCVDWHLLSYSFGQSILHNSPDVIDEIVELVHMCKSSCGCQRPAPQRWENRCRQTVVVSHAMARPEDGTASLRSRCRRGHPKYYQAALAAESKIDLPV
jgi:hypothetical protein